VQKAPPFLSFVRSYAGHNVCLLSRFGLTSGHLPMLCTQNPGNVVTIFYLKLCIWHMMMDAILITVCTFFVSTV
jgi:hypothetical protein